jgi:hypothetical protein
MDRRRLIGLLLPLAIAGVSPLLRAQSADVVVAEVEMRLRRPLSTGERRIVGDAARAWIADLRTLARRFSQDLGATTGLQAGQVAALVADIADPMAVRTLGPEIETLRDRPLTARQKQRIAELDRARRASVVTLDARLTDALATIGVDATTAGRIIATLRGR